MWVTILWAFDGVNALNYRYNYTRSDWRGWADSADVNIDYASWQASCTVNHASGVVNGHYSNTSAWVVNTTDASINSVTWHWSHGSHGSHGSW